MGTSKLPRGVRVRKLKNSEVLQVAFTYKGEECRESLKLAPSKKNITFASNLLGEIKNAIQRGNFFYADFFPNSAKLKKFGNVNAKTTVKYYLDQYRETAIKRGLSPTTIDGYIKAINALRPLWDMIVTELTPAELLEFVESQTVAPKTIRNRFSYLQSSLERAVLHGIIKSNPAKAINLSLYLADSNKTDSSNSHDEVDAFTPSEIERILNSASGVVMNIVKFWAETGVRSSEWSGLQWQAIDFVNKQVLIKEALVGNRITKGTKTKAGRRFIPLTPAAIQVLNEQKALTFLHSDYVFLNSRGKSWLHDSFRKHQWKTALKKAGVRYRSPYQLRHTFATRHISQGTNLWQLAKWMGHSSPQMLFQHYGDYIEAYEKDSPAALLAQNKSF